MEQIENYYTKRNSFHNHALKSFYDVFELTKDDQYTKFLDKIKSIMDDDLLVKEIDEFGRDGKTMYEEWCKANYEISALKEAYKKWLYIKDEEAIDIIMAVAISEKIEGDPLWLFAIAPPSGTKTETVRALENDKFFYTLSSLTPNSLISGYTSKVKINEVEELHKTEDLLPQLNGKVLILKDFTTVLEMNKIQRAEVLSQLRECYDGYYEKKFGSIDKKVGYKSKFGLIACVTPIIDKYWKVMQQLGERFLKLRLESDASEITARAFDMEGKEQEMRKELKIAVDRFLDTLDFNKLIIFDDENAEKIQDYAKFIAIARTPISIASKYKDFEFEFIPQPEYPARIVKQLKKLAKCLCIVLGKDNVDDEVMIRITRVVKDTIPFDRNLILEQINKGITSITDMCEMTKIPYSTIEMILSQLDRLGLIKEQYKLENTAKIFYDYQKPKNFHSQSIETYIPT